MNLVIDEEHWTAGAENWYYYRHIVSEGVPTTKLLDGVTFSGAKITNEYQDATFRIVVTAEAVQASNYAFVDEWDLPGMTVPAAHVDAWVAPAK